MGFDGTVTAGITYEVHTQERKFFVTINEHDDGRVCEIFVRLDDAERLELVTVITRLASMAIREGVNPKTVARELQDVYSPVTQHIIPGTNDMAHSLTARIGKVLEDHINRKR